jgi:exosome complex component MTR3
MSSHWHLVSFIQGMQLCLDACAKLAKIMRSCLKESASDAQGLENENS